MKWLLKIVAKLLLSRLPFSYRWWNRFGLFRHGRMDSVDYSIRIFQLHCNRAYPKGLPDNAVILELGPGDSVAAAVIAFAYKGKCIYLVDVDHFASQEVSFYQVLARHLGDLGLTAPDLTKASSIEDILQICNAQYLTEGLKSLQKIPSHSVDFAWSHSVLEHVRKHELGELLKEVHRIMKPGSYSSHNIDYQDHLDHSLNSLRFPERLWESSFFAQSGFYTNRIPAVKMHTLFRDVGFQVEYEEFGHWPELPISRGCISESFQTYTDEELINRTSHVLLKA